MMRYHWKGLDCIGLHIVWIMLNETLQVTCLALLEDEPVVLPGLCDVVRVLGANSSIIPLVKVVYAAPGHPSGTGGTLVFPEPSRQYIPNKRRDHTE
jgi:hypothetical protein